MMERRRIIKFALLGAAIALLILGPALWHYYLGPNRIRAYAISLLGAMTGGEVQVASGSFSLLSGITLRGIDIYERGGANRRPVLHVGAITLSPKWREALRGQVVLRRVTVDGLALNIELDKDLRWPAARMFTGGEGEMPAALPNVAVSGISLRLSCPDAPDHLPPVELSQIHFAFKRAYREPGKYEASLWSRDSGLGRFEVAADVFPHAERAQGTLRWEHITLGPRLQRHLPAAARRVWDEMNVRSGHAALSARFSWSARRAQPLDFDARLRVRDLSFHHVRIPYDFLSVQADARLHNNEVELESLSGTMGPAVFSGKGAGRFDPEGVEGEFEAELKGLKMDDSLRALLPAPARELWDAARPAGRLTLRAKGRMSPGDARPVVQGVVQIEDLSCAPPQLPFPLRQVNGLLAVTEERVKVESLAGKFGSGTFRVPAASLSLAGDNAFEASVEVEKLAFDGPCADLIPPAFVSAAPKALRDFLDKGKTAWKMDLSLSARRGVGDTRPVIAGNVTLSDGFLAHPLFGKPFVNIRAHARYADGTAELAGFVAHWGPSRLEVKPVKVPVLKPAPFTVHASVNGIELNDELRALLPADAQKEWDKYKPGGLCDAAVVVRARPDAPPEVDVDADLRDGTVLYSGFPYLLRQTRGRVEVRNNSFVCARVEGRHDDARLRVEVRDLSSAERSGLRVAVQAADVPLDKDLYQALLPEFRPVWDALSPSGALSEFSLLFHRYDRPGAPGWYDFAVSARFSDLKVDCGMPVLVGRANVVIAQGEGDDTGRLRFSGNASTPAAKFERIPLTNTSLSFNWRDNRMVVTDVVADCYGGALTGTALLDLTVPRNEFTGKLALYNADIAQVLADAGGESISGRVSATSKVAAELIEGGAFAAVGGMVIRSGRIGELPGLLGVLNLFVLNRPDAPVFHTLEVAYELHGPQLTVHEINLLGEILSLYGKGVITEDKKLLFRFTPEFGPQLPRIPVVTDLLGMVKGNLIPLTIRGDYNDPVFMVNPLMPVTNIMQTIFGQIAPIGSKLTEMLPKLGTKE